jgi:hypothetical protein
MAYKTVAANRWRNLTRPRKQAARWLSAHLTFAKPSSLVGHPTIIGTLTGGRRPREILNQTHSIAATKPEHRPPRRRDVRGSNTPPTETFVTHAAYFVASPWPQARDWPHKPSRSFVLCSSADCGGARAPLGRLIQRAHHRLRRRPFR